MERGLRAKEVKKWLKAEIAEERTGNRERENRFTTGETETTENTEETGNSPGRMALKDAA